MNSKIKCMALSAFSAALALPLVAQADLFSFDPTGSGHGIANVAAMTK